jgi:branched-chain amino acid transport system substrate-binding protein
MILTRTSLTRRRVLVGAGTLAGAALPMPFIGRARAAGPIRIGLLLAKTGGIAAQTDYLAKGSYLALEERGNKIMGQPAELVWYDEPTPQGA